MDIGQANIANLSSLWARYGATSIGADKVLTQNLGWPHRCWHENPSLLEDISPLAVAGEDVLFPLWPDFSSQSSTSSAHLRAQLEMHNWVCALTQTAMYLPLNANDFANQGQGAPSTSSFSVRKISMIDDISPWCEVVSDAFGYEVDAKVIAPLLALSDVALYVGEFKGEVVASALLYQTDEVIGLHQVGLKQAYQGQGLAKAMMNTLLAIASATSAKYMVLQASAAGRPLYEKLGFIKQFEIQSFRKQSEKKAS